MPQRKVILEELAALNSIKDLAQSYEEIAVVKMQKIKDSVIKTREFLAGISDVFVDLKSSYLREIKELLEKRKQGDKTLFPTLQKNGKTLLVYLASNGRLYGSVTQKTFRLFIQDLKQPASKDADLVVIGTAGKEMFEASSEVRRFEFFDLPDTDVKIEHIKKLMAKFMQYEKVYIYYGKFGNVVKQNPISSSITGEDIFETEVASQTPRDDRFIFEPELEKILNLFESEIMANLFAQTLLENQLARHASRVNAMEEALGHIEEETKKLNQARVRLKHLMQNKKQLETMAGVITLIDV